jgi:hypothetical protein
MPKEEREFWIKVYLLVTKYDRKANPALIADRALEQYKERFSPKPMATTYITEYNPEPAEYGDKPTLQELAKAKKERQGFI